MHRGSWFLLAALLVTGSACAHRRGTAADRDVSLPEMTAQVEVTNHYALTMEIYATASGATQRLGTVGPGLVGTFSLPGALLSSGGQVEFLAQPAAMGPVARSGQLTVSPGAFVEFLITAQLFNSVATVRR